MAKTKQTHRVDRTGVGDGKRAAMKRNDQIRPIAAVAGPSAAVAGPIAAVPGPSGIGKAPRKKSRKAQPPTEDRRIKGGEHAGKPRNRPGVGALKEIRKLQKSFNLLIPLKPFERVVRDTARKIGEYRITPGALLALQEASEAFLITRFENTNLAAIHANRVTITKKDMDLARTIGEK